MRLVGNPLEIIAGPVLKSLKIFLHIRLSSEVIGKSSEVVGNLWRSSEVFWNLWQSSEAVGKSSEIQILWRRKFSRILQKKSWQEYDWLFCLFFPFVKWDDWQIYCLSLMINDDWIHTGLYRIMFHVCSIWRPCTLWKN